MDSEAVKKLVRMRTDIHYPKPGMLSVSQSTELGTVYSVEEVKRLSDVARRHGLRVHMDGSRFANAMAHLQIHISEIT